MFSSNVKLLSLALLATLSPAVLAVECEQRDVECRCFPGDACWPSSSKWSALNETVHGKLIATVPLAAVCHDGSKTHPSWPAYDEAACSKLQSRWYVVSQVRYCLDVLFANEVIQDRPIFAVCTHSGSDISSNILLTLAAMSIHLLPWPHPLSTRAVILSFRVQRTASSDHTSNTQSRSRAQPISLPALNSPTTTTSA